MDTIYKLTCFDVTIVYTLIAYVYDVYTYVYDVYSEITLVGIPSDQCVHTVPVLCLHAAAVVDMRH